MKMAQLILATGARQIARYQSGWPMFFTLVSSFSRETDFTKFVSEEIASARSRHNSRRRRIPMPARLRHRARCNRTEARAGIIALLSCCLVRLSNEGLALFMRLSHFLRESGEVSAVVPRWRAAQIRRISVGMSEAAAKHCFSLCSTKQPFQIQNLSNCHATQRTGPTDEPLRIDRKRYRLRSHQICRSCCTCTATRLASPPEDPDAAGDDCSFFAVSQQQWRACVRRVLPDWPAYCHPRLWIPD